VLPARSLAAAPSGSRLPDGTGRGWVASSPEIRAVALIRVESHPLGPRVYVFGKRVHEVALGIAVLALLGLGVGLHVLRSGDALAVVAGVGVWLVAKDWRDLFPRWRNTQTHRRFGFHLHVGSRIAWRLDLPTVAATATLAVAAVNAASALTPNVGWRGHLLLRVEPVAALPIFHAVALPASVGLGLTAVYLYRRRRRALLLAIGLLLVLGVADELKGLDFEEAALSAGLAASLWYGRGAFDVEHDRHDGRRSLVPVVAAGLAVAAAGIASAWVVGGTDPSIRLAGRESAALLGWQPPPLPALDLASLVVHGLTLLALVSAASVFFRPRRPALVTGRQERLHARELTRAYGRDTLAAFKLREDIDYLFSPDRGAFLGYRVEGGVLLVAGDPIGSEDAVSEVMREARAVADAHGLRLGAVGASEAGAHRWRAVGLRSLYVGDEAIVATREFSLEGRPIRKVRQSVSRMLAAGYTVEIREVATLSGPAFAELEAISARWRNGEPERGFAMATRLTDPAAREGVVVIGRDESGAVRGWLHYLPSFGRPAMSLALMRRDRDTPNGLMEFLVVRSIELLRERGVTEISLNFAAFARPFRRPRGALDHVARGLLGAASRWFQIESLYRFNAKFFPRWEPRFLVFDSPVALPRIGFATLVAEGQLRRPTLTIPARLRFRPRPRSG